VPQRHRRQTVFSLFSIVMGPRQALALVLTALMITAGLPREVRAQGGDKRTRARALLVEGQKLHDAGEYGEALDRFEKAYALVPSPKIQFNFGLAYNGLDRPADAMRAFQSFLAEAGDAPPANVAKEREYVARLTKRVGPLELDGDTGGAEVSVDGRSFGGSTRVLIDPGPHQLTVDKPGRSPFLNRLTVAAGERVRITVRFPEPAPGVSTMGGGQLPATGTPSTLPPQTASAGGPLGGAQPMVTPNPPPEEPKDGVPSAAPAPWQYTAGWVSTGIAVVLLGGGLAGRLMANKKYADFNAYRDARITMCNRAIKPDYGGSPCRELLSSGDTYSTLSWVGVIGGGAAAVAAVVFFVSAPSPSHTETAFTCAPTLGVVGASCRMTF